MYNGFITLAELGQIQTLFLLSCRCVIIELCGVPNKTSNGIILLVLDAFLCSYTWTRK